MHEPKRRDEMLRELLYGIDWVPIQETSSRLIVLWDPDSQSYVYPVSFEGDPDQRVIKRPTGALDGARIAGAFFGETGRALRRALEPHGLTFIQIAGGGGSVAATIESGGAEIGLVRIDDPTAPPAELN